jgi:hypothetical protein
MALLEQNEKEIEAVAMFMVDGFKIGVQNTCIGRSVDGFCDGKCVNCRVIGDIVEASRGRVSVKMEPVFRRV